MSRRRSLDPATVSRIAARTIVEPVVAEIGPLVGRAIFLETMALHRSERHTELREEAETLAEEARERLKHLDLQLMGIPTPVAAHASIADTRNALVAVAQRFDRARRSLLRDVTPSSAELQH